jgi:hypothetical protein
MSIPFPKINLRVQLPAEVAHYYKAAVWQYFRIDKVVKPMVFDALTAVGFNPNPPSRLTLELPFVRSPTGLLMCLLGYFCVVLAGLAFWKAFPIPAHLKKVRVCLRRPLRVPFGALVSRNSSVDAHAERQRTPPDTSVYRRHAGRECHSMQLRSAIRLRQRGERADCRDGAQKPDGILMKLLMLFHNVFLTLLSLYMCVKILYEAYTHEYVFPTPTLLPVAPGRRRRQGASPAQAGSQVPSHSGRARIAVRKPRRRVLCASQRTTLTQRVGGTKRSYSLWGNAYDPSHKAMAEVIWVFYVSKIYEFMDTFIMILKGNTHQVRKRAVAVSKPGAAAFVRLRPAYILTRAHAVGGVRCAARLPSTELRLRRSLVTAPLDSLTHTRV